MARAIKEQAQLGGDRTPARVGNIVTTLLEQGQTAHGADSSWRFCVSANMLADCEKWLHAEHLESLFPLLGLAPLGLERGLEHLDLTPAARGRPRPGVLHRLSKGS